MKSQHVPTLTILIGVMVLVAQFEIAWFLNKDWKFRLQPWNYYGVRAVLWLVWLLTAAGFAIDLLRLQYRSDVIPALISGTLIAFGTAWGFTSFLSINIYAAFRPLLRHVERRPTAFSPARRAAIRGTMIAATAAPAGMVTFGGLVERTRYVVREVDFPIPDLHPDLEGLRVAQISDLHVSPFLSVREAGRVVDITNELKPNLTLVTGDLITQSGDPLDATIRELARLRAEAGVLGCLGNHEVYAKCEDYTTLEAAKVGIDFLRMRHVPLRWGKGTLNVAGVDFQSFARRDTYLHGAEKLIVPGAANILLSHNPDVFPSSVLTGYDAMIGGHTHGGQVTVEILNRTANLARFFTPYVAGLYRLNGRSCYVNAGIGTIGMPVRFGAPPEITLLRLRRA